MKIIFLPEAEAELENISDFIAEDNPLRAVTFVEELTFRAEEIANHPLRYSPLSGFPNIRKRSYKGYVILYEIVDDGINILHVLNSYRNYISLLNKI